MTINISSRDLRGFLALAETRHFRLAAERSRLSQPAFSQLIQRVEAATAARLFERSTRQVTLTSEGEVLVAAARRILEDIDTALADLRDHAARRKGRVAIAALPSLAAGILPGLLAGYCQRHPGVAIELFDVLSDRCVALVREGRADFAVAAAGPNLSEFETRPLAKDGFHLVCRRDHALAGRRRIGLRDLASCALIHLARTSSVRQHLDPVLREARHASTGLEVEQLPTVAALVSKGLGVSLVPTLTLAYFRQSDLVSVPLEAPGLSRRILAVLPRGRGLSPAAKELLGLIEAELAPARRARR